MKKPIIIFGAGASHDVIDIGSHSCNKKMQPPLTNGLFDSKWDSYISKYSRLEKMLIKIREHNRQGKNFEDFLRDFKERIKKMDGANKEFRELQLIELELYLRDIFSDISNKFLLFHTDEKLIERDHVNNYIDFLDDLSDAKITEASVITFNYDLFLDKAFRHVFGYQFKKIESYHSNPIKLFKVHGSVNWGYSCSSHNIQEEDHAMRILEQSQTNLSLKRQPPYILDNLQLGSGDIITPSLAIPLPQEKDFIVPEHQNLIAEELNQTDKIVVIGWSASDEYFVSLIRDNVRDNTAVKLIIINPNNATEIAQKNAKDRVWQLHPYDFGFSNLMGRDDVLDQIFS